MTQLVVTGLPGWPLVRTGDDLAALALDSLARAGIVLADGDVVVFTSKVISKAEGRARRLSDIRPSPTAVEIAAVCLKDPRLIEVILSESRAVLRLRPGVIIVEHRLGFVCANAGVDHSNAGTDEEEILLLPQHPDASAARLRSHLRQATGADIAVIINDSHGRAWRMGTVGVAIGVAGMLPLTDRRGDLDLFGRALQVTVVGAADELAAAASLVQGAAAEGEPVVHIRGACFRPGDGHLSDLLRPHELDLFR